MKEIMKGLIAVLIALAFAWGAFQAGMRVDTCPFWVKLGFDMPARCI